MGRTTRLPILDAALAAKKGATRGERTCSAVMPGAFFPRIAHGRFDLSAMYSISLLKSSNHLLLISSDQVGSRFGNLSRSEARQSDGAFTVNASSCCGLPKFGFSMSESAISEEFADLWPPASARQNGFICGETSTPASLHAAMKNATHFLIVSPEAPLRLNSWLIWAVVQFARSKSPNK